MVKGLHLSPRHREEIEALLRKHLPDVEVWVYGSRVNGQSHEGSDLDLVLRGPKLAEIDTSQLADFIEALQDSTIPFLVEVRDWTRLPKSFHCEIDREYVVLVEKEEQSRLALNLAIADEVAPLRDILAYTRDGEWGAGDINANLIPMRVIRGTDFEAVNRGSLANVPIRHIRPDVSARKTLEPWDILIETAGGSKNRPTGRTLLVHPRILERSEIPVTCASFARFLRIHCDRANPAYIYWFLQHLYSIGEMEKHQVQHTGVARFQFTDFAANIEVPLPPLPKQRAIAHILGTLDDKIELNRRMNGTLEAMARALFKSWFVDFDPVRATMAGRDTGLPQDLADLFPDRMVDSELGEIPEGWEVKALGECVNLTMGQSPPGSTYNEQGEGLPFFQGRSDFGFRYPENRKFCTAPTRIADLEDTLVSVRAPVGDINMAWERCCIGRGVAALRHKSGSSSFTYHLAWAMQRELQEYEHTGTVFGAVNKSQFEALRVIEPDPNIVDAFDSYARPIDARIRSNIAESYALAAQRDVLLPKLVSGEIHLHAAERAVENIQ